MIRDSVLSAIKAHALPPMPKQRRPIVIIGAGGIVRSAHLPAYEKGKFSVIGLMDQSLERADLLAKSHAIARTFDNIDSVVQFAPNDVVYDIAVPASQLSHILPHIPDGSAVLMQKPMGETIEEARIIRDLCRTKNLTASVNFSLRYSPNNLAISALARAGLLGDLHDLQVQTTTYTPWDLWTFLATAPRVEIMYHSIHYFDLIRSWLGNPNSVYAKTVKTLTRLPWPRPRPSQSWTTAATCGSSLQVIITTTLARSISTASCSGKVLVVRLASAWA
ncbi:Gfo/Idh/MocA family protein [Tunturiibacter gelidiferens]|uniref:Gfo/Idh/MocA family protein n=1 Tax=Tunturiibacter gelidiferens TaxID=3069689 RepID=UPI003D9B917E